MVEEVGLGVGRCFSKEIRPSPAANRHTRGVASSLPRPPPAYQGDEGAPSSEDTRDLKHGVILWWWR